MNPPAELLIQFGRKVPERCNISFTNIDKAKNKPMANEADEDIQLATAPFDPRFPNANQTKHCFVSFLDYHRCRKARGEEYEPCNYFQKVFTSLCPSFWIEKWEEQMENGTFPAKI